MSASRFLNRSALFSILVIGLLLSSFLAASSIHAQSVKQNLCGGADLSIVESEAKCNGKDVDGDGEISEGEQDGTASGARLNKLIAQIINVLSVIIGIVAVIFIIIGGFKYITSGGDSGKVQAAKTTIVYSLVGLLVVAFAQIMVQFVVGKLS